MSILVKWVADRLIPLGMMAAGLLALVLSIEHRGAEKAIANVEKNNAKAQAIGRRASGNAGKPVPGSVRDPGYRVEE